MLFYANGGVASSTGYSPATPGNWNPAPTMVNAALDQLAVPTAYEFFNTVNLGPAATITFDTTSIASKKSGVWLVTAEISVVTTGVANVFLSLIVDPAGINQLIAFSEGGTGGAGPLNLSVCAVFNSGNHANRIFRMSANASAGTITCNTFAPTGKAKIVVLEAA